MKLHLPLPLLTALLAVLLPAAALTTPLNTAQYYSDYEDDSARYGFDDTNLSLSGDWYAAQDMSFAEMSWQSYSNRSSYTLTGSGNIDTQHGCFSIASDYIARFTIGSGICLVDTDLQAVGAGTTVVYNGSLSLSSSSTFVSENFMSMEALYGATLDLRQANLSHKTGDMQLYLVGGSVLCSGYTVDAHNSLHYQKEESDESESFDGSSSFSGTLTLGAGGRVSAFASDCLQVTGDIVVTGNTVFDLSFEEGFLADNVGQVVMTATGTITGDASALTLSGADNYGFFVREVDGLSALVIDFRNKDRAVFTSTLHGSKILADYTELVFQEVKDNSAVLNTSTFTLQNNASVSFLNNGTPTEEAYLSVCGGAIRNGAQEMEEAAGPCLFTMNKNGDITFSGNTAIFFSDDAHGGAIFNGGSPYIVEENASYTFTMNENGDITFSGNSVSGAWAAYGGAISNMGTFTLNENGDITFIGNWNSVSGHRAASGGAISNMGTFTLNGNGDITFSGNSVSGAWAASGGAISNMGTFTLNGNGDITFSGNSVSEDQDAYGGAIYNYGGAIYNDGGSFELSENGDIIFSGNTISSKGEAYGGAIICTAGEGSTFTLKGNGAVTFSENSVSGGWKAYGGAIYSNGESFDLSGNGGDITFSENSVSGGYAYGGAIYNIGGSFELSENGDIIFSGNAISSEGEAVGGAIYTGYGSGEGSTFTLKGNGAVTFGGNSVSGGGYAYGGAIYSNGESFDLSGNGDITFSGNTVSSSGAWLCSYGGAIYNDGVSFDLSENGDIIFSGNTISSEGEVYGGAICTGYGSGEGSTFTLKGNGAVSFIANAVSSESGAFGGAIYNYSGSFDLSGNGDITFSGNTISSEGEAYGGAIYNVGESFDLSENGDVVFLGNTAAFGSAIYNGDDCPFTLTANGHVSFLENTGRALGNDGTFMLSGNKNVSFNGNIGGAISSAGAFALTKNGDILFSENTNSSENFAQGGAICNYEGEFSLSENGDVTFSGNSVSSAVSESSENSYSPDLRAFGGAILNGDSSSDTLTLSGNGDVTFSGNTVSLSFTALSAGDYSSIYGTAGGGAISNAAGTFMLSGNGNVTFSGNTVSVALPELSAENYFSIVSVSSTGGAIDNNGAFELSGNGDVSFSENTAWAGGAIYHGGDSFELNGNGNVVFNGNTAASGGAISSGEYGGGSFTLNGNGDITFSGNAVSSMWYSSGGAISAGGVFEMCENEAVSFSGNTVSVDFSEAEDYMGLSAHGGAISLENATFTLSGNADVTFSGNTVTLSGPELSEEVSSIECFASGGAISGRNGTLTLSGNGDITFSGNTVSASCPEPSDEDFYFNPAAGGAIYSSGTLELVGNGDVLFEKNAEIVNGVYRLRSIYSEGSLNLSAAEGKSITFRDAVYSVGDTWLNDGGSGRIVISGATTEADLLAVKGSSGTAEEILSSRSSFLGNTTLCGGTLRAEHEVTLGMDQFTMQDGTTLELDNACLVTTNMSIDGAVSLSFAQGAQLTVEEGLSINEATCLTLTNYDNGFYTLLRTSYLSGAENLTWEVLEPGTGTYDIHWIKDNTVLVMTVSGVIHRSTLTWNEPSGVWQTDGSFGEGVFKSDDEVIFASPATVTVRGEVTPWDVRVENESGTVCLVADSEVAGSGIAGETMLTKSGEGSLVLNGGNTYSGGTVISGGTVTAAAADSFGTGGIALSGGTLDLNARAVSNAVVATGGTISGGSVYAGDVTVEGPVSLSGALTAHSVTLRSGSLTGGTLTDTTVSAEGGVLTSAFAGQSVLIGNNFALISALSNSGTLTLRGSFDVSALAPVSPVVVYEPVDGGFSTSGFAVRSAYGVRLVDGGTTVNDGANISYRGASLTLRADGMAVSGSETDYGTYYVNTGHSVSTTAIHAKSAAAVVSMGGGTLTVNDTASVTATGGTIMLRGGALNGTLSGVTIDAASGALQAALNGNNTLNGSNYALQNVVDNKGLLTVSGSFNVSALALNTTAATHVDVNGNSGASGFAKEAVYTVQVVDGGTVQNTGATITHGAHMLVLGTDGLAVSGGAVDYSAYLLTGDAAVSTSAIHAKAAGAVVSMDGGTLSVNDSAEVTATGGTILLNGGTLSGSLSGTVLYVVNGALTASLSGNNTLSGSNYALQSVIANTGVLSVGGSFNASALALNTTAATRVDVNGNSGASGFAKDAVYTVQVVDGGTVLNNGATITHGSRTLVLGTDGLAVSGGAVDYSAYLLTGDAAASTSAIHAKASAAVVSMDGGTLTVNDTADVTATGGTIALTGGTLNGALSGTVLNATSGALQATLSGSNTLNGSNYALQNIIDNKGALTVSGSFNVSALALNTTAATHVDVNGNSGASGFAKDAVYTVQVVDGGTVQNAGATIKHGSRSLVLGEDGLAVSGGAVDYSAYLLTGDATASTAAIHAKAAEAVVSMDGGTLTVNDTADVTATGGTIVLSSGTLSGSLSNVSLNAEGGALSADMRGGKLSVNGNVSLSGFNNADIELNSGRLTAAEMLELDAGQSLCFNGGRLTADVLAGDDSILTLNRHATLNGNLTLDGGDLTLNGNTLNVEGSLNLVSATQVDISSYGLGSYKLLTFAERNGQWDKLILSGSSYRTALKEENGALTLTVKELNHHLTWNAPKGVWSTNGLFGNGTFCTEDDVSFLTAAAVTISGAVAPETVVVNTLAKVTFTSDKKVPGSGITGEAVLLKDGEGTLTMNAGNTYTGGTTLNAGIIKATAADSFGTGAITVNGGTLDLGSKAVGNAIVLSGAASIKGDAKYTGAVSVNGNATLLTKTAYKGMTTVGSDSSLTLAEKATMAGSMTLDGGRLLIRDAKGLTLAKNASLQLSSGGFVRGLLTIGAGSKLVWEDGSFAMDPVLKGGTLDFGGEGMLTLSGSKALVQFGEKHINLPGKGVVYTDETLTVNEGTVTVSGLSGYDGSIEVAGGTLKLATGKAFTDNAIIVNGNAAVVNGKAHFGDITVNGMLAKGTNISVAAGKTVSLNGAGTLLGTIAGAGTVDVNVDVNASIDATAAKMTAAYINLNSGTYINTKGIKIAKGQTLTLGGVALKGALATAAGSTLALRGSNTLSGSLTLGGGSLVFDGGSLTVKGTLTLSKAMTVSGRGVITYTALKPFKGDIAVLFGGAEVELNYEAGTLTFNGGAPEVRMAAAPMDAAAEEAPAPLDAAPVPMPAANPVADAMVQADWGILDAERAFMGAVANRSQHAALLDKGRGAAWVSAFGASVRHGNQGTHHGSDGNIEGAAFGLEHAVSETGTLGLAVGRSKNRLAATGVTHLRQETAHVALYGQKQLKHGFTADAAATYGDTETKLGAASWQQKSAALSARLTHARMLSDATAFRTFGGLTYEATESASILGEAHSGSVQNLRGELGAGITHTAGKAHFYAEAALTGDMVRHNPTVNFGGVRTHGANPGRLGLRATVGGIYEFTDTWSGTASYGIEAESRSTAHTLNIGVSKSF